MPFPCVSAMRAHDGAGGKAFILWSMLPCYIPVDWPIALMAVLMEKVMGVVEGVRGRRARGKGMSTTPRGASVPGYLKGRGWKSGEGRAGRVKQHKLPTEIQSELAQGSANSGGHTRGDHTQTNHNYAHTYSVG